MLIPTYNREKFISDCIQSVIVQSLPAYEIIVIDDCSTDDTLALVSSFSKVKFHVLEKNYGGPAWPRNFGINLAKGDFIALCDADDVWHVEKLRIQAEVAEKSKSNFVSCSRHIIKDLSAYDTEKKINEYTFKIIKEEALRFRNPIVTSSAMIAANILKENLFLEIDNLVAVEDYELYTRLHKKLDSIKIDQKLVGYLENGSGISSKKLKMLRKLYILKRRHHSILDSIRILLQSVLYRVLGRRS